MGARLSLAWLLLLGCIAAPMKAAAPEIPDATVAFAQTVQPFLKTYCASCHGGARPAAQLDLMQYATVDSVVQDLSRWNRILSRLSASEMPPRQAAQPPDRARQQVIEWIQTTWTTEARRRDGDPGLVLARRLSNAEYDYTIRDLTGVDIRPDAGVPGRSRQRGRLRQLGRVAGDVAGPAEEISAGRADGRRSPRPQADGIRLRAASDAGRHRPRQVLRPADRRLLRAPADRLRRLFPRRLALQAPRGCSDQPTRDAGRRGHAAEGQPEVSGDDLAGARDSGAGRATGEVAGDVALAACAEAPFDSLRSLRARR